MKSAQIICRSGFFNNNFEVLGKNESAKIIIPVRIMARLWIAILEVPV